MQISAFRYLALGVVIIFGLGSNIAMAQEKQPKKTPIAPYNAQGSAGGAAAPVFLSNPGQGSGVMNGVFPRQNAMGMKNANVASSPKNVEKAKIAYEEARAKQEATNQQIRDSRTQAAIAQFEESKAKDTAADQARLNAKRQAAGLPLQSNDPSVIPTKTVPVAPLANPYAGSKVIFANPKKDPNAKPSRLFNAP